MSHTSPASFLVWAVISSLLGIFLVFHLWSFDRFKCLKWNNGPYSGAFKRVMTYSYLLSVPLIITYAVGFAIIKYREGFLSIPLVGIIPKPYELWSPVAHSAVFPLTLLFSIAWSLEMVTHLEELCFWLFLINARSNQQDWFHSLYFKTWVVGSTIAVICMPLITIFTRSDLLKAEAYTFLAGSLGSLSLTLWFTPILWTFPNFLASLKAEGVDINTIVRLTKFSELNTIRVVFRFLFTVPLLVLGIDGVRPHHHINENMFWTDFLAIIAGFGCSISSGLTLVIFFPRSIEGEIANKEASRERRRNRSQGRSSSFAESHYFTHSMTQSQITNQYTGANSYLLTSSPTKNNMRFDDHDKGDVVSSPLPKYLSDEERDIPSELSALPPIRPNRRRGTDVELGGIDVDFKLTENNISKHNMRTSNLNPMVHNFTSPIDLQYGGPSVQGRPRYVPYTRR